MTSYQDLFVVRNDKGEFLGIDSASGGYPWWSKGSGDQFTLERAKTAVNSEYALRGCKFVEILPLLLGDPVYKQDKIKTPEEIQKEKDLAELARLKAKYEN